MASKRCLTVLIVARPWELDLDVKNTTLKLSSPRYKLSIHLPHKVDGERGKAKWDAGKKVLSVTLRILREDPF
ncbi:hypothetical protein TSOC_005946 [Tetrabaena socialis]|uniref:PIH1D1/2/3 CS-like domain-containing protein n=1 Tax=Tetrabaena socialis TaxID=47790 RepID=A0A2J8A525_9CHLO|nr:hypothetical protein TSOC_005946 [Tetrabaena socialis]|eukprot:PNH07605.1 hypothetical protein TSOC_005946 [Tetrabaena socialis]